VNIDVAFDLRPAEQVGGDMASQLEQVRVERRRRGRAEIDRLGARLTRAMNDRMADAAEPGIPRLDRAQRKRGRKRRIDRAAAGIEHRDAGFGGILRLRYHHAAPPRGGGLCEVPMLGDVGRGCELHDPE
jgi:hypothetical protein